MFTKMNALIRLIRPPQWLKNGFIFAPLIFSKHLFTSSYFLDELQASIIFCLVSSMVYVINDIADEEADKLHPIKRNRPIAAGTIRIWEAILVVLILFCLVWIISKPFDPRFWIAVSLYAGLNLAYSFYLKHIVLIDVFIIAAGFMLRVLAGAYAIQVEVSSWLILCTLFISVFLAVSKRRSELLLTSEAQIETKRNVLKFYDIAFMDQIMTIAASGMAISYALYSVAERTIKIFGTENLIFTTIFVLFGIFRYIFLMRNKRTDDNPTHVLLSDLPMIANIVAWFLTCVLIIYFQEIKSWF